MADGLSLKASLLAETLGSMRSNTCRRLAKRATRLTGQSLVGRSGSLERGNAQALCTAIAANLFRRALHRTIRTEHTAVAGLGPQNRMARRAFVEELAGVGRHDLDLDVSAAGTGQGRLKNRWVHRRLDLNDCGSS